MSKGKNFLFFLIIISAAVVYVLSSGYVYVGYYEDDAWYANTASYLAGVQTRQELRVARPLGYPFLLVPVVKLFPHSPAALKAVSILFMLLIPFGFFYFLRDIFDMEDLLILIGLICFHYYTVTYSGVVLSEVPYMFFSVIILVLWKCYFNNKNKTVYSILLLTVPVAFMFYLRSQGVLFFAAISIYFIFTKRFKELIWFVLFYLILVFPVLYLPFKISPNTKYIGEIKSTYGVSSVFLLIYNNILYYFRSISDLFIIDLRNYQKSIPLKSVLYFASGFIFYFSVRGFLKDKVKYMIPIKIYICLYLVFHLFWVNVSLRYMVPLVPFLLYYLLTGLKSLPKYLYCSCVLVFFASNIYKDSLIIKKSLSENKNSHMNTFETFEWIRENTEERAIFAGYLSDRFFFNTKRKMIPIPEYDSRDELYLVLLDQYKSDYVVKFSLRNFQKSFKYSDYQDLLSKTYVYFDDSTRFEKVYENKHEYTAVWRVIPSTGYLKAWKIYVMGLVDYKDKKIEQAKEKFIKALKIYPDFPQISLDLAVIYIKEKNYHEAREVLDKAIDLYPKDPELLRARGIIYMIMGLNESTLDDFRKALGLAKLFNEERLAEDVSRYIKNLKNKSN